MGGVCGFIHNADRVADAACGVYVYARGEVYPDVGSCGGTIPKPGCDAATLCRK